MTQFVRHMNRIEPEKRTDKMPRWEIAVLYILPPATAIFYLFLVPWIATWFA